MDDRLLNFYLLSVGPLHSTPGPMQQNVVKIMKPHCAIFFPDILRVSTRVAYNKWHSPALAPLSRLSYYQKHELERWSASGVGTMHSLKIQAAHCGALCPAHNYELQFSIFGDVWYLASLARWSKWLECICYMGNMEWFYATINRL